MPLRRVLSTVLVTVAYYLFSLIIEPRVLLCARIVKPIRSEQHLILCIVIGSTIWTTAASLPVASPSHHHRGLASGDPRTQLLSSVLLLVGGANLVVSSVYLIWG